MLDQGRDAPSGAPTSWSVTSRRRPTEDRARPRGPRGAPRAQVAYRDTSRRRWDSRRSSKRQPGRRPGRRAGRHERPGERRREAPAGRRGTARRRRRGHHHVNLRPRVAQRRERADHRRPAARDGARTTSYGPADQIELVDMSPQALRRRMAHGNVYSAEKLDSAPSRDFREGNLTVLRSLVLLGLADRVDEGLERYRDQHEIDSTWAAPASASSCRSAVGPESSTLMRRAARIATRALRVGAAGASRYPPIRAHRERRPTSSTRLRRQGQGAGRHLPHGRRRRPGRRDPGLRPRGERDPGRDRRQPAWPGLDAAPWPGVGERVVWGRGTSTSTSSPTTTRAGCLRSRPSTTWDCALPARRPRLRHCCSPAM